MNPFREQGNIHDLTMSKYITFYVLLTTMIMTNGLYNVALFKPAIQSTIYNNQTATIAVDGDVTMDQPHTTHTQSEQMPWWMVDLKGQFTINQIVLTNRDACCAQDLQNFTIDIFPQDPRQLANFPNLSGDVCYSDTASLGPSTFTFNCLAPIVGRYVRLILRLTGVGPLHFSEMNVMASESTQQYLNLDQYPDKNLSGLPFATMTTSSPELCVQECLLRRLTYACTALSWVMSAQFCQLYTINPFLDFSAILVNAPGTISYIQNNSM